MKRTDRNSRLATAAKYCACSIPPLIAAASTTTRRPCLSLRKVLAHLAVSLMLLASGCGRSFSAETIDHLQSIECRDQGVQAVFVGLDVSQSGRSQEVLQPRIALIRSIATQAAVCGRRIRVVAFAESVGSTATLLSSADIAPIRGATDIARLRRVPDAVAVAMAKFRSRLDEVLARSAGKGTDVGGQLDLASEFVSGSGADRTTIVLLTDGLSNREPALSVARELDSESVPRLARMVEVPRLGNAHVIFAGIGDTAHRAPSTARIRRVIEFWKGVCTRTGATCTVSASYPEEVAL
jgi:hypothetical protein